MFICYKAVNFRLNREYFSYMAYEPYALFEHFLLQRVTDYNEEISQQLP